MKIEIFDVEHGQCSLITAPNGKRLMIDAGHNTTRSWYPSTQFYGLDIEEFVLSNYDEDHASDFRDLKNFCHIAFITRNHSVTADRLAAMKAEHGMGTGIKAFHEWMKSVPIGMAPAREPDLGQIITTNFSNSYPTFTDANNLSVVTFVEYYGFSIVFPGDLEEKGWLELLKREDFCQKLANVNVLVASHHGRANGYCAEVFEYCNPQITIISDGGIQHATQNTVQLYNFRSAGIPNGRSVYTTRHDGTITINVGIENWNIAAERGRNAA